MNTMTVEMSRREALDYMRACTAMMIAFRRDANHAKDAESRMRALRTMEMWSDRHELIAGALRMWDAAHE